MEIKQKIAKPIWFLHKYYRVTNFRFSFSAAPLATPVKTFVLVQYNYRWQMTTARTIIDAVLSMVGQKRGTFRG